MKKTEQNKAVLEEALKLRNRVKKKKPKFVRQESWRYKRLDESWRRPKGIDNKMRRKIKGWPPTVSIGYRGPKIASGLHPSGHREVLIHNVNELKKVNPNTQAIRIAHTVGKRKRADILVEARKTKVKILNFKEPKESIREEKETEEEKPEEKEEAKEITEKEKTKRRKKKSRKVKEGQRSNGKP